AAAARIEAVTKRPEDELGTCYKIEGTAPTEYDRTGCADGTTIVIRDLFYNTPARLKFLKKDVTEGNYCANVVEKLALSHPDISFRFIRDGKQTLFTPGDAEYFNAIHAVFGKQFAAGMIPVDNIYRDIGVTGFVSSPLFTRSNRTMQNFFINGRSVKNPICCAALEEAFRNSIMTGKFPTCVLNVNLDPALLDANISPAKTEVRFSNDKAVFDAVYYAVKNSLLGYDESREIILPKSAESSAQSVSDNADSLNNDDNAANDTIKAPTVTIPTGGEVFAEPKTETKPDPASFFRKTEPYQFPAPNERTEQTVLPEFEPLLVDQEKPRGKGETPIEELPGLSNLNKK
ncbi:MAG: DNA mismatch repair endonuclease MutL, partial [Oscillospiraceae bacterium]|nr:DNA mismatch repair endonuclease MutL [Oscillospiraceae bacterium]